MSKILNNLVCIKTLGKIPQGFYAYVLFFMFYLPIASI